MRTRLFSGAAGTPPLTVRRAATVLLMMVLTTTTAWANSPWGTPGNGTANDPYQISTAQQWKDFAAMVNGENGTYGDKCYKLTADIEVTGTGSDDLAVYVGDLANTAFRGTFDGGGHTLTFNFSTNHAGGAPFRYINGATISNLRVAGRVSVSGKNGYYAAGIAGNAMGSSTISDSTVGSTINSSGSGSGWHGGLVGEVASGATLTVSGCTFSGSFTGSVTLDCGGFVGYNMGTVSITDCLFDPSTISIAASSLYSFCNNRTGSSSTLTRAYRTFDSSQSRNQGTRAYTEAPATPLTKRTACGDNTIYVDGAAAITGVNDAYAYTGSSLDLPTAGVRFDGAVLAAANYDVVFRNGSNTEVRRLDAAGTYTLTATGKDDYAGSVSKTYTVTAGDGSQQHPYLIGTPAEWDAFDAQVTDGNNYSGKYVSLTADISVTTMAGNNTHSFNGTFLGGGHTLTVDISDDHNCTAPFRYVNGATISDLTVAGSVSSNGLYAATLVAKSDGSTQFTNCHITATLNCTWNGFSHDGGFVGVNNGTLTFDRCSFKGSLLGAQTYRCGGFVGLNQNATANFTDCLFAPAAVTIGTNGSGTFVQPAAGSGTTTFTRTYYTTDFGAGQGTKVTAAAPAGICKPVVSAADGATYYGQVCSVSGIAAVYPLGAEPVHPEAVVTDGSTTLTKDVDYVLHWDEERAAEGDYTLTVAGIGNYTGSATVGYMVRDPSCIFGGQPFTKGTDGAGDYFVIATEQDLRNLSTAVNAGNNGSGKRFVQTADIDLSNGGTFTPIGIDYHTSKRFSGTYDGGHHAISGLKVSTSSGCAGLFGELSNGTVKNVRIMAPSVTSTEGISGAVVGRIRSGTVTQCITINPTISGGFESGAISGFGNCTNSYYYGGNQTTSGTRVYKVTLSKGLDVATAYTGDGTDANGARISSGTYAGYYAAEGKTVTLAASDGYTIGSVSYNDGSEHTLTADANGQYSFIMPASDVTVTATLYDLTLFGYNEDPLVDGSAAHPYIITTAAGWNQFCDALEDNTTWNCFIGKTVKLGNSFSVTRTAGSSGHDFCGTFDGQHNTLIVSLSGAQYVAPFFYVKSQDDDHPATIQNLVVDGTVTASGKFAAGIAGGCAGKVNITNCLVRTTISSSVPGDGTHGGLVGVFDGGTLNITGCAFTGKLLSTGSPATTKCGGIVGYSHVSGTAVNITNSLYAPAALVGSETEPTGDSKTFLRSENTTVTITNSYYTRTLGDAQGTTPYIYTTKPTGIGTEGTMYNVSGITAYTNGINQNGKYYTTPPDPAHFAQDGDEYTIKSATGWDVFCDLLGESETFSGKTVKLGDNISVTRMAGSNNHRFAGTFDGQGNTLTVSYEDTGDYTMTAPFSYVDGATIRNLVVGGSITDTGYRAAGIIGETSENLSHITNCMSSVNISGGRYTAGFSIGGKVAIEGCVFNGIINGSSLSGGFVGWSYNGLAITNCLFAPQDGSSISGGTFYYNGGGGAPTPTNSYYTTALGTPQGAIALTTATLPANIGTAGETYGTSGITSYTSGLKYGGLYYMTPEAVSLADNQTNDVDGKDGYFATVTLQGRTLYKDGNWNTLCLPFSMTAEQVTAQLAPKALMTLGNSEACNTGFDASTGTLNLDFVDADEIEAGVAYIVKWGKPEGYIAYDGTNADACSDLVNPTFSGVTVENENPADKATVSQDDYVQFVGTYDPVPLVAGDRSILYLGSGNQLYWPDADMPINAFRAYFQLKNGLTAGDVANARLLFGDGDETQGISLTPDPSPKGEGSIYTLDGVKLDKMPTRKSVYIRNGRKVVVK